MPDPYVRLDIFYDVEYYDGETSIACKVRYPVAGGEAIQVSYAEPRDSDADTVWGRAYEDIRSYVEDPQEWIEEYRAHRSTDLGVRRETLKRRLQLAEEEKQGRQRLLSMSNKKTEELRASLAKLDEGQGTQ